MPRPLCIRLTPECGPGLVDEKRLAGINRAGKGTGHSEADVLTLQYDSNRIDYCIELDKRIEGL